MMSSAAVPMDTGYSSPMSSPPWSRRQRWRGGRRLGGRGRNGSVGRRRRCHRHGGRLAAPPAPAPVVLIPAPGAMHQPWPAAQPTTVTTATVESAGAALPPPPQLHGGQIQIRGSNAMRAMAMLARVKFPVGVHLTVMWVFIYSYRALHTFSE